MSNQYYTHGSFPSTGAAATSASMRAELDLVSAGFDKLPALTGNANKFVVVNSTATGLTTTGTLPAATVNDNAFTFQDEADNSRKFQFRADGISPGATRYFTMPDADTTLVGTDTTQTLTNKTLTSPVIGTIVNTGTLTLPTSTDTLVGRNTADTLTNKTLTNPVIGTIINTGTLTLPTSTDTLVGRATSDTLTNKTISGATNVLSNIANASLSNSAVTIGSSSLSLGGTLTALQGVSISGAVNTLTNIPNTALVNSGVTFNGTTVALGGSATIKASTTNALTIGNGLSGTSFDGGSAVTIAINTGVTADLSTSQTFSNKTISGAANTLTNIGNASLTNSQVTIGSTAVSLGATATALAGLSSVTVTGDPTAALQLATKQYVDNVAQGLNVKASVVYSTTANIALLGLTTQVGGEWPVALTAGDRVLVKNQTVASQNGIYAASATGWSRTADADTWNELVSAFVFVSQGATLGDTGWVCTADPGGTLGSTNVPWSQFSGAGTYTAGNGLTLTGTQFSINTGVTADLSTAQTLTNKTLTSPTIGGSVNVSGTLVSNLIFTDNTYDIGASGATRPRNLYLSGVLSAGGAYTAGYGNIQSAIGSNRTFEVGGSGRANAEIRLAASEGGWENAYAFTNNASSVLGGFYAGGNSQSLNYLSMRVGSTDVIATTSTYAQIQKDTFIGVSTTGGVGVQTGLAVIGGANVSDNTPGVITIGSHYNTRNINDDLGQLNFYSNDASGGASGVQASVRAITATALGDAASLAFYTKDSGGSLALRGSATYAGQWQFGGSTNTVDGNFRLTLWGSAGQNTGISMYETSTGKNGRLRIYQADANVYYDATYSSGGNNHNFQIGSGNVAQFSEKGLYVGNGSVSAWFTGGILQGASFSVSQVAGVDQTAWATGLYQNVYTGSWLSRGAYRASMYQQSSGGHSFFSNTSTPTGAGQTLTFVEALTITPAGDTGMGISNPAYKSEVMGTDTSSNRTNPYNVMGVSANSGAAPYTGFGAGLVFRSSNYSTSSLVVGGRVRNKIWDNSASSAGSGLAFDVTLTRGGALYQAMEITYDGQILAGTQNKPVGTTIVSERGYSSTGGQSLIQNRTGGYLGAVTNLVLFTRTNTSCQGWAYVTIDTIYGTPASQCSRTVVMVRGDMTYSVISQTGDSGSAGYGAISFSVSGNDFRVSNSASSIYFSIQCQLGSPNYASGYGWEATWGASW